MSPEDPKENQKQACGQERVGISRRRSPGLLRAPQFADISTVGTEQCLRGKGNQCDIQVGQERNRPLTAEQQLQLFEQQLASLNWHEQQASIQEMVSLEEELSRQDLYSHCLHRQPHITWKTRAVTLDWAAQVAT